MSTVNLRTLTAPVAAEPEPSLDPTASPEPSLDPSEASDPTASPEPGQPPLDPSGTSEPEASPEPTTSEPEVKAPELALVSVVRATGTESGDATLSFSSSDEGILFYLICDINSPAPDAHTIIEYAGTNSSNPIEAGLTEIAVSGLNPGTKIYLVVLGQFGTSNILEFDVSPENT